MFESHTSYSTSAPTISLKQDLILQCSLCFIFFSNFRFTLLLGPCDRGFLPNFRSKACQGKYSSLQKQFIQFANVKCNNFNLLHVHQTSMNVKPFQRFVQAGDALILLGVTAANVPPEKSLMQTHRDALVSNQLCMCQFCVLHWSFVTGMAYLEKICLVSEVCSFQSSNFTCSQSFFLLLSTYSKVKRFHFTMRYKYFRWHRKQRRLSRIL